MSGFTKNFEKDDGAIWDLVLCIKTKLFRKLSWNGFQKCLKQTVFYKTKNIFMQMFAKDVYLFI